MKGSQAAHQSFRRAGARELASDGDLRKWRCRKAGFSQGEFQQGYAHTHTHESRGKNNTHISGTSTTGLCLHSVDTGKAKLATGVSLPSFGRFVRCLVYT